MKPEWTLALALGTFTLCFCIISYIAIKSEDRQKAREEAETAAEAELTGIK